MSFIAMFLTVSYVPFVEVHYLIAKKTLDEVLFHTLEKKTLSVGPQLVAMEMGNVAGLMITPTGL